jgi:Na+-translocating ferredoxin:NAD+ oxidoreductase RnfE subunit
MSIRNNPLMRQIERFCPLLRLPQIALEILGRWVGVRFAAIQVLIQSFRIVKELRESHDGVEMLFASPAIAGSQNG